MNKHFIRLAIRNILKNKLTAFINIIGLSISLAAFIMITIYVLFEYNYDRYNDNSDQIYKVEIERVLANKSDFSTAGPYPMSKKLVEDFPEITNAFRVVHSSISIRYNDKVFDELNSIYSDNSIFHILTIPFISGDPQNALKSPNDIVITESYAKKLFGDDEAMGKELELSKSVQLKVVGVIKDFPANSHFRPDVIVSIDAEYNSSYFANEWGNNFLETYILLDKKSDWKDTEYKIRNVLDKYKSNVTRYLHLNKLVNVHLHPDKETDLSKQVIVLGLSGLFILLIAFFNYVNLNMAANTSRYKEVSIKKLFGSNRLSILIQFIGESLIIVFIAFDLSLVIVEKLIVKFSDLLGSKAGLSNYHNIRFILLISSIVLILGIFSGVFSGYNVSKAKVKRIKYNMNRYAFKLNYKKILLGFQFVISIIMIVLTLSMLKQFDYLKNKDLGFDKDNLLITSVVGIREYSEKLETLKQELNNISGVNSCSYSFNNPYMSSNSRYILKNRNDIGEYYKFNINYIDKDFIETYGLEVIKGNELDQFHSTDAHFYCIINEAAAKVLGWDDPIGKMIYDNDKECEIVGVVKDFHLWSINEGIPPVFLVDMPKVKSGVNKYLAVNVSDMNKEELKNKVTEKTKEIFPEFYNSYYSMNDFPLNIEVYNKVEGTSEILGIFSFLAIFISCMGVFGFVSIHLKQRTKELGIRKVLGSSINQIFKIIFKDFLILISISTLISIPISIYFTEIIFREYAYTTSIGVWIYIFTVLVIMVFTLLSIAYHALKAARTNPVEALRYE